MLKRLVAFGILLIGAALAGTAYYVYAYESPISLPSGATVAVLSGPGASTPGTEGETRARVDRAVSLWQSGVAARIVMSGHGTGADEAPNANNMRDRAMELGTPEDAILLEAGSHSTLQNALMTRNLAEVDPAAPVILVTHRYHLPRAWASFRWAGFTDITLVAADDGPMQITSWFLLEGIKWPFNLARASIGSLAIAAGAEEAQVIPWLQ